MNNNLRKALALLPLLLMGAGVWYYVQDRMPDHSKSVEVPAGRLFGPPAKDDRGGATPSPAPRAPAGEPAAGAATARLPEPYDPRSGLEIQGPPEFKSQVTHALKLIWMADRDSFMFVRRNLYVVRNENRTGFYMENGTPVAAVSRDHAFRSLTWCAGVIAHQAWHAAYELNKAKKKKGRVVPPPPGEAGELRVEANPVSVDYKDMSAVLYVEEKAFSFQLDILRKVGAPPRETGSVLRRGARDFSLAHDGNYSIKPCREICFARCA